MASPPPSYFELSQFAGSRKLIPNESPNSITYVEGARVDSIPTLLLDEPPIVAERVTSGFSRPSSVECIVTGVRVPRSRAGSEDSLTGSRGSDSDSCAYASDSDAIDFGAGEPLEELDPLDATAQHKKKKKKKKKRKKIYWIKHRVSPDDTLAGICLRYDVEASMLKRLNAFTADHFWMKEFLVVPTTDPKLGRAAEAVELTPEQLAVRKAQKQKNVETTLRRICPGLGSGEIKSYLKLHNYSISRALAALEADDKWEADRTRVRGASFEDQVPARFLK